MRIGGTKAVGFRLREMKKLFFTSPAVKRALDKRTYHAFLRFGQYVRKVARHSIVSASGPSKPGTPPHSHVGLLKRMIFYAFALWSRSVVIGPTLVSGRNQGMRAYGTVSVPEVLEYGGTVRMTKDSARRAHLPRGTRADFRPRPFMGPAFEKGQEKLDTFWSESVVK